MKLLTVKFRILDHFSIWDFLKGTKHLRHTHFKNCKACTWSPLLFHQWSQSRIFAFFSHSTWNRVALRFQKEWDFDIEDDRSALQLCFRVLKPGTCVTITFSSSKQTCHNMGLQRPRLSFVAVRACVCAHVASVFLRSCSPCCACVWV